MKNWGYTYGKKHFTDQEIKNLSENTNLNLVSSKNITYFRSIQINFISENKNGKFLRKIFGEDGFNDNVVGIVKINRAAYRWKTTRKQ